MSEDIHCTLSSVPTNVIVNSSASESSSGIGNSVDQPSLLPPSSVLGEDKAAPSEEVQNNSETNQDPTYSMTSVKGSDQPCFSKSTSTEQKIKSEPQPAGEPWSPGSQHLRPSTANEIAFCYSCYLFYQKKNQLSERSFCNQRNCCRLGENAGKLQTP